MINLIKAGLFGLALYSQGALGKDDTQNQSKDLQQRSWDAYKTSCPAAIAGSEKFQDWKDLKPDTPQNCSRIRSLTARTQRVENNSAFSTKQDDVEALHINSGKLQGLLDDVEALQINSGKLQGLLDDVEALLQITNI